MHDTSGKDGSERRWSRRVPPAITLPLGFALAVVAIVVGATTDIGDRIPVWLAGPLVIAAGVAGLVVVARKDWAEGARKDPSHILLYLLRPLPLVVWRVLVAVISLGVVVLGVGAMIVTLT